ncbi:MAG: acetate--CoA ligase [Vicinamibacterales bacterium]
MSDNDAQSAGLIGGGRLYYPDPARAAHTHAGSVEAYEDLLRRSREQPDEFWAGVAAELEWMRPWDAVTEGRFPHFTYFVGGVSNPTLSLLDRHLATGAANRLAMIWEGEDGQSRFFTYQMLAIEVNKFANVLKGRGVVKGDAVAIFTPNLPEAVIAVLACFRLGALFNTVFSGFSARSLRDRLEAYNPKVIVTADASVRRGHEVLLKPTVDAACEGLSCVKAVIVVRRTGTPVPLQDDRDHWWHDLMRGSSGVCDPEPMEANEPGIVFYTSGTTGKPKGIVHSAMAFLVNNYVYAKFHLDHHPSDVLWCTADIGWLTMHIWGIVGALANGVTTVIFEGAIDYPTPDRFYQIVDRYRVNKIFTAPTAIRMLMRHGDQLMEPYDLSCLEVVAVVGEPFNPEAWHWTYETLGKGRIYLNNTWGQTELGGCPLAGAAWLTPMKPGSCGPAFLAADLDIVDDAGNPVGVNVTGNLVIRRPFPMMLRTLWKEPDRFVQSYFSQVDGCYFTNDAAIKDSDGHFWVTGRVDDVINVAGHRLSTMEMESAIMECRLVAEVAVVGMPDTLKGLVPIAFVTLKSGQTASTATERAIREQVADTISKIAVPERVVFTDVLPKTPSGKIMRRLLKEIVTTGEVGSDVTALEDLSSVEKLKALVWPERS